MKTLIPYIGSKKNLLKKLQPMFPVKINNYYEPFIGGGSVLFFINENNNINKNYINDLNKDVINVYKSIKTHSKVLCNHLDKLNIKCTKEEFDELIKIFNENKNDKVLLAAIYIFVCKRSFNGKLNVKNNIIRPYFAKQFQNSDIYEKDNILSIKKILSKTKITNFSYDEFLNQSIFEKDDFVFMDPPYLTKMTKYLYKDSFDLEEFNKLKNICDNLNKQGVNFMLTVNKHDILNDIFNTYNIKTINKYSGMSHNKIEEYVITNYNSD